MRARPSLPTCIRLTMPTRGHDACLSKGISPPVTGVAERKGRFSYSRHARHVSRQDGIASIFFGLAICGAGILRDALPAGARWHVLPTVVSVS